MLSDNTNPKPCENRGRKRAREERESRKKGREEGCYKSGGKASILEGVMLGVEVGNQKAAGNANRSM